MPTSPTGPVLDYATETVLRPRLSSLHVTLTIIGFCAIGTGLVIALGNRIAIELAMLCGGLGLLMLAMGTIHVLPGVSYIRVGQAGFWIRLYGRQSGMYRWDEVLGFEVVSDEKGSFDVHILLKDEPETPRKHKPRLPWLGRKPKARRTYLTTPEFFGLTAQELATLLEHHRNNASERHLQTRRSTALSERDARRRARRKR
jgi:hypothetical protein